MVRQADTTDQGTRTPVDLTNQGKRNVRDKPRQSFELTTDIRLDPFYAGITS